MVNDQPYTYYFITYIFNQIEQKYKTTGEFFKMTRLKGFG